MNCAECREKTQKKADVPYIVYESERTRHERYIKRLVTVIVLLIVLLLNTNLIWAAHNYKYHNTKQMTIVNQNE
jgi:hypothetical protein